MVSRLEEELERIFEEEKSGIIDLIIKKVLDSNINQPGQQDAQRDYKVRSKPPELTLGGHIICLTFVDISRLVVTERKFLSENVHSEEVFQYAIYGARVQQEEGHLYIVRVSPPTPDSFRWRKLFPVDVEIIKRVNMEMPCLGYRRIGDDNSHYFIKEIKPS